MNCLLLLLFFRKFATKVANFLHLGIKKKRVSFVLRSIFRKFAPTSFKKEMSFRMNQKITEQESRYKHLEQMSVAELLMHINEEDAGVAQVVSISGLAPVVVWVFSMPVSCLQRSVCLTHGL